MKAKSDLNLEYYGVDIASPNRAEAEAIMGDILDENIYMPDLSPDSVKQIVDIGAHIGLSAIFFTSEFPDAQITAYEPNPSAVRFLESNCSQFENIEIEAVAVSNQPKREIPFYISKTNASWWSNSSIFNKSWSGREITSATTVPNITFKALLALYDEIDILKIDIEGAEHEIFKGITEKDLQFTNYMIIEVHDLAGHSFEEFNENIINLGFEAIGIIELSEGLRVGHYSKK